MEKSDLLWITLEDEFDEKLWPILFQWKIRLSAIWIKCIQNFLLPGEVEIIDRNHESSVLSCLISTNACEFLILFFLLVAGYFVPRCLLFVSRASSELQTELEKIKPFTIESYISELEELVAEYSKLHYLPFKDLLLFPLQEFEDSLREIRRLAFAMILGRGPSFWVKAIRFSLRRRYWNLINFISLIPNPIHPIAFWIKTRHLSRTSKELHLLIRKGERGNSDCIAEKIESWAENSHAVENQDKPFLIQFANLTTEKRIDQILLSLTYSDPLSNSDAGYHEEPGFFYLRSIVDIHKKDLMNYEFNRFSLAEKRIFLAHYQTITYSQTSHGSDSTLFPSHGEPFSFRVDISPSRGILLLGSRGTGRSYLVKYLATNSYVPFITVFPFLLLGAKSDDLPTDNEIHAINNNKIHAINEIHAINKAIAIGLRSVTAVLTLFNKYRGPIQSDVITNLQLAKAMSPCIIWIPSIHDLNVHESNYFKLGLLVNYLSKDWESARKILVIASTHIPKKLDPALLATDKLNTCIKVRRPLIPQQRRHFCIVSYTRGVDLEGQICHTNGFGSITVGSNARDLAAFSNQALSLTIGHKKSIMETKTIELVLHRQIWDSRADLGSLKNHGIAFYQIGRAVAQNLLISNCPLDLLSSYVQKRTSIDTDFYLYRWYFELETSMKKFTILLYLLSCSAGSVAQDLWSALGDEKDWIASYRFVETDSDVVHGLLEVEGALVGSSRTEKDCSQFDNNRVTLLLRSEARNPLDMMQNGFDSILDHNEKNKWEEWGVSPETKEERERLVDNRIVWAPRLWRPCGNLFDCIEMSNELGFPYPFRGAYRFGGKLSHEEDQFPYESPYEPDDELEAKARDRFFQEENFLVINRFIWDPPDAFFSLFEDGPAFSRREFFADEEMLRVLPFKTASPRVNLQSFFSKNKKEKHFELLIHRQRRINSSLTNSSLYKGSFRSNILSASYHYLSNLFLSKGRLLDQLTKTLLRKRWLFLDEMKDLLHERGERFPIP
uniref:Ycf2 n=1 Tax=Echinodorus grisebachii TaxID=430093 RepID=UPI00300129E8|nr:Ycf2 [Echinodorus grisebachii]